MFDVGFWELLIIFGLGLIFLGPERLPKVAGQVGRWVGRARRTAGQLRRQLEQEINTEERNNIYKPPPPPKTGVPDHHGELSETDPTDPDSSDPQTDTSGSETSDSGTPSTKASGPDTSENPEEEYTTSANEH